MIGEHAVDIFIPPGDTPEQLEVSQDCLIYILSSNKHYHYGIYSLLAPLGFNVLAYEDAASFAKDYEYKSPSIVIFETQLFHWGMSGKFKDDKIDAHLVALCLQQAPSLAPPIVFLEQPTNPPERLLRQRVVDEIYKETLVHPNWHHLPLPFDPEKLVITVNALIPAALSAAETAQSVIRNNEKLALLNDTTFKSVTMKALGFQYDVIADEVGVGITAIDYSMQQALDKLGFNSAMRLMNEFYQITPLFSERDIKKKRPKAQTKKRHKGPKKLSK